MFDIEQELNYLIIEASNNTSGIRKSFKLQRQSLKEIKKSNASTEEKIMQLEEAKSTLENLKEECKTASISKLKRIGILARNTISTGVAYACIGKILERPKKEILKYGAQGASMGASCGIFQILINGDTRYERKRMIKDINAAIHKINRAIKKLENESNN